MMRETHPLCQMILWWRDHVRPHDKLKTSYLSFRKVYDLQTWQVLDLLWEEPPSPYGLSWSSNNVWKYSFENAHFKMKMPIVRPHLDYGDIIYDQSNNKSFCNKIQYKRVQYNAALAITGAIRGTSQTKLYHELGLESLKFRRWMRRLCMFYKIKTLKLPEYLYNLISNFHRTCNTQNVYSVEIYFCRTDAFKYSFFPIPFLNGTNLTQTCAMLNHTQHSENCYWGLVRQAQIIFTKSMIL